MRASLFAPFVLAACVTTGQSPVDARFTGYCAAPTVAARFTDPDGLPALYDDALAPFAPEGLHEGSAVRFVEAGLAQGLAERLPARFGGAAPCALDVTVENVILPDKTRYTPLSGQKSFLVRGVLRGPDGAVLAETTKPFTVLAPFQKHGRLGGSAWRRIGRTEALRAEALDLLTASTVDIVAEAFGGGRTQTGLAGKLRSYPDRLPPG